MSRLVGLATVAPDLALAEILRDWWKTQQPKLYLSKIYQYGPYAIREAETARRIVGILEEHGWLVRLAPNTIIDGAARRDAWELVPKPVPPP